jgi:hypothetical protein
MTVDIFDLIREAANHRHREPTADESEYPEDVTRIEEALRADPNLIHAREEFTESTPLHVAAVAGLPAVAELLLGLGAEVNALAQGFPPLIYAVSTDDEEFISHIRVAEVLIRHGADVNFCNEPGQSLLEIATRTCKDRIAHLLRAAGAMIPASSAEPKVAADRGGTKVSRGSRSPRRRGR